MHTDKKNLHAFPYGRLSGETYYYNFQFSTYCCVRPKDLYPSHVFIGYTNLLGFDAVFCIKKYILYFDVLMVAVGDFTREFAGIDDPVVNSLIRSSRGKAA